MSELIFYTNPQSRGQIARWALEEAGAEYDTEVIDYGPAMKSAGYLAINPMGKVPAIVHNGKVITECAGICAYLAEEFPDKNLRPTEAQRADYYRWMFFAAGPFESAVTNRSLGVETDEQQQRMAGYGSYDLTVNTLHTWLGEHPFICGDQFTMADVYVGSHIDFGLLFGSIKEAAHFSAYVERLRQRPAYQTAKAKDMALMPESGS